jgi:anti-sigma factor RsiW
MNAHPREALEELLDGELTAERRGEVEAHVARCRDCGAELARLREVSAAVRSLPERPLPAGFLQRLQRRRAAPAPSPGPRYLLPAPARYAAFALSSVIVSFWVYEKARVAFPVVGYGAASSLSDSDRLPSAALSPADAEAGRAARAKAESAAALAAAQAAAEGRGVNSRRLARASGQPLFAGVAAPGTLAGDFAPGKGPSNDQLIAGLESEKAKVGIRGYAPKPPPELAALKQLHAGINAVLLKAAPTPAPIETDQVPSMLSRERSVPARREEGAPVAAAEPQAAPAAEAEGLALRSAEERDAAWAARGLRAGSAPSLNFEASLLALVVAPDLSAAVEIVGVETRADAVVLRYRLLPRPAESAGGRKDAAPVRSYQYRVIPRSSKPLRFERVD